MKKGNSTERNGKRKATAKKATAKKAAAKKAVSKKTTAKKTTQSSSALKPREQEELVLEFRVKARKLGRSILRKWHARLDLQEVDSIVDLSLCEAVKRFDPKKGASFMTFLYYHLKGNLIRAVSSAAQANFIPGLDTERERDDDGPAITALEVVEAISGTDQRQPDELLLQKELVDLSMDACTRLDPLEKQVIERLYLQGEQLMQIANTLGYSRCHISRVKKKALEHLQSDLDRTLKAQADQPGSAAAKLRATLNKPRKVQRRKRLAEQALGIQKAA